jgi:hypothetical protein
MLDPTAKMGRQRTNLDESGLLLGSLDPRLERLLVALRPGANGKLRNLNRAVIDALNQARAPVAIVVGLLNRSLQGRGRR